jgi:hypothetical protein
VVLITRLQTLRATEHDVTIRTGFVAWARRLERRTAGVAEGVVGAGGGGDEGGLGKDVSAGSKVVPGENT